MTRDRFIQSTALCQLSAQLHFSAGKKTQTLKGWVSCTQNSCYYSTFNVEICICHYIRPSYTNLPVASVDWLVFALSESKVNAFAIVNQALWTRVEFDRSAARSLLHRRGRGNLDRSSIADATAQLGAGVAEYSNTVTEGAFAEQRVIPSNSADI